MSHLRIARLEDLERIAELGQTFGHLMGYMRSADTIEEHISDIMVYEASGSVEGFYHCKRASSSTAIDWIVENKVFPTILADALVQRTTRKIFSNLGVCMQGGCHRDVFQLFIKHYQKRFKEIWCWTSVLSEGRTGTYEKLGFSYNPEIKYTFPNPNKDGLDSTYQLGIWKA